MIRVFPRKTKWTPDDNLAFIGDVPMFRPVKDLPVRISCTFTWDIEESERLKRAWSRFYSDVQVGGPAYDDPGGEFKPGRFVKNGSTHTSRGCPKECEWCLVPNREGPIRELEIKPGWNVCDNNLLACSESHVGKVFEMLRGQKKQIFFTGGLDIDFLTGEHVKLLKSVNLGEAWFACDYPGAIERLRTVAELLTDIPERKRRCYVLIGFNGETIWQALTRLKVVYALGFLPFAILHKPIDALKKNNHWSKEWLQVQKYWCRPAIYKSQEKRNAS